MSEGGQNQNGCAQGCGGIIMLVIAYAVISALFGGGGDSDSSRSSSSSSSSQTVTMRGDILVYDQSTCARGPMVKVSAGARARGPQPSEFSPGNAPCRLVFTMQVPANASQYKVQVENLPARIFYPDQMRNSKGEFEVKMTVYGD